MCHPKFAISIPWEKGIDVDWRVRSHLIEHGQVDTPPKRQVAGPTPAEDTYSNLKTMSWKSMSQREAFESFGSPPVLFTKEAHQGGHEKCAN